MNQRGSEGDSFNPLYRLAGRLGGRRYETLQEARSHQQELLREAGILLEKLGGKMPSLKELRAMVQ